MICDRERLAHFLQQLKALSSSGGFTKSDLLTPEFHLAKDGDLDMYYSLIMSISTHMLRLSSPELHPVFFRCSGLTKKRHSF